MQTRLLELSEFQHICSLQEEIAKKFCRCQIREEGTKLNSATQNAIEYGSSGDQNQSTIRQLQW